MEREARGGACPLVLEMSGRRDDDEARGPARELVPGRSEREGRLPGPGRRDGEEVPVRRGHEAVEGGLLPVAEVDGAHWRLSACLNDPTAPELRDRRR